MSVARSVAEFPEDSLWAPSRGVCGADVSKTQVRIAATADPSQQQSEQKCGSDSGPTRATFHVSPCMITDAIVIHSVRLRTLSVN